MISLRNIVYNVDEFELNASLDIENDEYRVLFGMTGCGKTTLLESICGLRQVSSGEIIVGNIDITNLEPRMRQVGYVPQDGALFDHLSVRANIEFALKVRGVGRDERNRIVEKSASDMRIAHLLERRIPGLSGGERQRVALSRALVSRPKLLLLDEPVSALDEFTRDAVCRELVRLHRETGIPILHVCHSFEEARMVSDNISIMRDGRIVQTDTPDNIVSKPHDSYVANILRLENIFTGDAIEENGKTFVDVGGMRLKTRMRVNGRVSVLIHPWKILLPSANKSYDNVVNGVIEEISSVGPQTRIRLRDPLPIVALLPRSENRLELGDEVRLVFDDDAIHVFEMDG